MEINGVDEHAFTVSIAIDIDGLLDKRSAEPAHKPVAMIGLYSTYGLGDDRFAKQLLPADRTQWFRQRARSQPRLLALLQTRSPCGVATRRIPAGHASVLLTGACGPMMSRLQYSTPCRPIQG
jgi:hypothetical protein